MNIPRLKRMIEVLEEVEAKHAGHFDTFKFAKHIWDSGCNENVAAKRAKRNECGTTACAIGWFKIYHPYLKWDLAGLNVFALSERYFGLDDDQWSRLFMPTEYAAHELASPRHVINRIREMIGEGV